jgi:PAS domain S-box-containing protein/putative nucleotidyltransferase with HDIG domain
MLWQWSPGVIAELVASAVLLLLAIYTPWRDLNRQARLTGVTLIFVCALWMLSNAIEIGLPVATVKESMLGLQLVLGTIALTFWLFYIFHYLGPRKLLALRTYILFGIVPLIAILGLSTNNAYGLMWTGIGIDSQNPYLPLQPTYGIIYWACMAYSAALILTGSFIIFWNIFRHRYGYNREWIYLLVAASITLITAFIEVMGLLSHLKLPIGLTPWAACIGAIILIFNLPRFHTEQVIPVARDIIFEQIGDCILVLDMQNRVLDLNPAAEQLTGCRIADAFGLSIEQIWPYRSTPMMPFNNMAKAGEQLILERDNMQRVYDLRISTISDAGGRLTSQVVLLTDITGRRLSEKALRESEQQYRILFQGASQGIGIVQDGMFKLVNPKLVQMIGYTEEEILSKSVAEFVHPDSRELVMERDMRRLKGEIFENAYQFKAVNKSGDTRWVEISTVLCEWAGRPATLDYYDDITERKSSEENLLKSYESLKKTLDDALVTMVKIVELRDPYTAGHQQKVAALAIAIAREMKLEDTRIDQLRMAAVIHDIGKMYVPSDILSKPGKLLDIEFDLVKTHSQSGYDIVKSMDFPCSVAKAVLQHHERLDGSGYPNQLKGEDTILEAKILAVADVIEAMAAHRPYRPALGIDKALEEISKNRGELYDPDVVDTCLELFKSSRFDFKSV